MTKTPLVIYDIDATGDGPLHALVCNERTEPDDPTISALYRANGAKLEKVHDFATEVYCICVDPTGAVHGGGDEIVTLRGTKTSTHRFKGEVAVQKMRVIDGHVHALGKWGILKYDGSAWTSVSKGYKSSYFVVDVVPGDDGVLVACDFSGIVAVFADGKLTRQTDLGRGEKPTSITRDPALGYVVVGYRGSIAYGPDPDPETWKRLVLGESDFGFAVSHQGVVFVGNEEGVHTFDGAKLTRVPKLAATLRVIGQDLYAFDGKKIWRREDAKWRELELRL